MQCAQIHTKATNKQKATNRLKCTIKPANVLFFGGTNWQSEVIDHSAFVFSIPKKNKSVPSTKYKHTLLHIFHTQNKLVEKKIFTP